MAKKKDIVIHNVEQGTPEWFELRKRFPLTASKAQAIGNNGKGLETLVWEKMAERYSSGVAEQLSNPHIDRGVELEPQARSLYELETGNTVETVGFVTNSSVSNYAGASPDGLVSKDGLLEIKCADDKKHFRMIVEGVKVDPEYEWQAQMQMLITGRKWCDICFYNPNFTQSLLIQRIKADKESHDALLNGIKKGEEIIKQIESKI